MTNFVYAGVGARKTPAEILSYMQRLGQQLALKWHLNSGYADGADKAFGLGAFERGGSFTMFTPWDGYAGAPVGDPRFITPKITPEILEKAATYYDQDLMVQRGEKPAWDRLKDTTKCMMARNVPIFLGSELDSPVDFAVGYTSNGRDKGGTGMGIRLCKGEGIPFFNLFYGDDRHRLIDHINSR